MLENFEFLYTCGLVLALLHTIATKVKFGVKVNMTILKKIHIQKINYKIMY